MRGKNACMTRILLECYLFEKLFIHLVFCSIRQIVHYAISNEINAYQYTSVTHV